MLIFYNGEIMSNVTLLRDRDNSVLCLEHLGWQYHKFPKNKDSKQNLIPYVSLPDFSEDGVWENCNIGYIDVDSMELTTSEVVVNNIKINKIEVCKKDGVGDFKTRDGNYPDIGYIEYFYNIDISFSNILNKSTSKSNYISYVFQSYDIIWKFLDKNERKKYSRTMRYLFVEFPEIIRNYLEGNEVDHYFYERPLSLLNFDLLQKGWPNKEMYNSQIFSCGTASHNYLFDRNDHSNLPYTLENAILTLLSIQVEKKEEEIMIRFGNGDFIYLNIYFESFFEFVFNQKLFYDKNNRTAYCSFKGNIPFNLSSNDDIAAYIACSMHLYLYKYFDLEASRQLCMVNIPQELKEYSEISIFLNKYEKIDIEEDFYDIYRFMYCCEIEHKQHGTYRVGKDDMETQYKYYEFRPRKGHIMSKKFIDKIDLLLQTKLKYEEEETGWHSYPERYNYCNTYFHDYVAGSAESRDLGSIELRNASFLFVSNYFIKEYLIDKEDFKRFYN